MGAGKGGRGAWPSLEILDHKVIIRKPKEKEQNIEKNIEKMWVTPLLAACQ
jgi:hypothetical protein